MRYNKAEAPVFLVKPLSPSLAACLDEIRSDGLTIVELSIEELAIETQYHKGGVCLLSLDIEENQRKIPDILAMHPSLSLIAYTANHPNGFFPFLKRHNCGTLLLEKDMKELLNNTVHAFYVDSPEQTFSVSSILKGRFTVDERKYERRRIQDDDLNSDSRRTDRRQNTVVPLGSIFEFGDDPEIIRIKILNTVQQFFLQHELNFLMEEATIQIGIDELVSNILRHAYDKDEQKLAHLILVQDIKNEKLILLIQDYKGKFTKDAFLEEMVRTYNGVNSGDELGLGGTGFRFVRQCSDLLVISIIRNYMTKFILLYDIDRIRRQEYPDPGEKSMLIFEYDKPAHLHEEW